MAGPFRQEGNTAPEIKDVRLAGGGGVAPSGGLFEAVAGGIVGVAAAGLQYAQYKQEQRKKEVMTEAGDKFQSILDDLTLEKYPSLRGSDVATDSLSSPVVQNVAGKLEELRGAGKAGRLTQDQILTRMNLAVNQAVAADPKYRAEIVAMARDTYGFVPSQKMAEMLLAPDPREAALAKLEAKAAEYGVDVPTYQKMMFSKFQMDNDLKVLNLQQKTGEMNFATFANTVSLHSANASVTIWDEVRKQLGSGGVRDPEQLKGMALRFYADAEREVMAGMPAGVDMSKAQPYLSQMRAERDALVNMIDNGDAYKMLTRDNELMTAIAVNNMQKIPTVGTFYSLFPNATPEMFSYYTRILKNPTEAQRFFSSSEPLAGAAVISKIVESMELGAKVYAGPNGVPQFDVSKLDESQRRQMAFFGLTQLRTASNGQQAVAAATKLKEVLGNDSAVTISSLTDKRAAANIARNKEVWPIIINTMNDERNRLTNKLLELQATGKLPENAFTVRGGEIVIPPHVPTADELRGGSGLSTTYSGPQRPEPLGYSDWVKAFNRLNSYATMYGQVGVLTQSNYGGMDKELADMRARVDATLAGKAPEEQATQPTTTTDGPVRRKARRDANGNWVFE